MLILLSVLKIIGVILLIILFLLLLICALVLFSPIKYSFYIEKKERFLGHADASWFFGILKIKVFYREHKGTGFKIKVLWFDLTKKRKKKTERNSETAEEGGENWIDTAKEDIIKTEEAKPPDEYPGASQSDTTKEIQTQKPTDKYVKTINQTDIEAKEQGKNSEIKKIKISDILSDEDKKDDNNELPQPKRVFAKFANLFARPLHGCHKNKNDENKQEEKAEKEEDSITKFILSLPFETKKILIKKCLKFIKRMLKCLLPKELFIEGEFGTSDPALTGRILGVICMVKGIVYKNINVKANFNETVLKGSIKGSGKIRLCVILYEAILLLLNKTIRQIIIKSMKG